MTQYSKLIVPVAGVMLALAVGGCASSDSAGALAIGPDQDRLAVPSDYATRAIVATGGLQPWMASKSLDLRAVVTLYQADQSFYLTQQHYQIYPWSRAIRVSGLEPGGRYTYQLSQAGVVVLDGANALKELPTMLSARDLAEAVVAIVTVPVRFLDTSCDFVRLAEPARIGGQWYDVIQTSYKVGQSGTGGVRRGDAQPGQMYWSEVVLYQNRNTSLVSAVWLADERARKFLAVRGYDYRDLSRGGLRVPGKIEIFETDPQGASEKRLVKIDLE